ncbi:DUF2157 domain-containing protein [Planococcus sp. CP5-4]|uniref:DUF2157 domain-containing protein n=1 Tax=unclassified Planococcus (in: firmicutes) TaxID=2662419 RepID=UPI001C230497|nr:MULTISPECIES: DUF2157 domain-containing protein [unclassified Planococcus (in: firmicutes)]MBU9673714.1 DUF2157 domain-containing protein [Planococcus sp. CP5-4_YE]MBV0908004.1 DUF2157 domain-containing protein [Planococcus sp. CP5-4_UN]MBW6063171.1 DUF2157 domain-containing protein [Planococcus sp. CP5-4]
MEWEHKLAQWRAEGLIDQETAERIRAFETRQPKKRKLPLLLIIGLIFFALAVFSFIAANWQAIPAIAKVGMVVLLMWIFYVLAHFSEKKHFGHPIIFRILGYVMFGASLIVTGQTFHLGTGSSIVPWALFTAAIAHFFIWRHTAFTVLAFISGITILTSTVPGIGLIEWLLFIAVAIAWFFLSKEGLAMIFSWLLLFGSGFLVWSLWDIDSPLVPIWTLFALMLLLLLIPKDKQQLLSPLYLIVGGIQLIVFLAIRGESDMAFAELAIPESIALAVAGTLVIAVAYFRERHLMWLGVLGLVGFMLFDETAIALAIVAELTALAYLIIAQRQDQPLALGFVYFIVVQFVIYVIYAWERLDMSLFFLIGALLLFLLSGIAWWLNRKKEGAVT